MQASGLGQDANKCPLRPRSCQKKMPYVQIVYLYRLVPSEVHAVDALDEPFGVAIIVAVGYVIYAQNVCHALIGFNRYFAIVRSFTTVK